MKPKTLRQVVLIGYSLYNDRKTHLSVNKTEKCQTSSNVYILYCHKCVYHDNLFITFYDDHVIDNSSTMSLDTSDSVTFLKCGNILTSIKSVSRV